MNSQNTINQAIGGIIEERLSALLQTQKVFQEAIKANVTEQIVQAKIDLNAALYEVEKLRDFVQHPENILGSILTKHGEIAEQLEVRIHNARQLVYGQEATGIIETEFISRTGPVDYNIDGLNIQSKFCNCAQKSFMAVKEHLSTYPDFIDNNGFYHIPKEQHEILMKILHGEPVEGMRNATQFALKKELLNFEEQTGHSFEDIVKPSISEYPDVQIHKINKTINSHEQDLCKASEKRINNARKESEKKYEQSKHISDPSWSEAVKTAAIGAAIGGTIQGGIEVYHKLNSGKKFFDFTEEDWKDIGITFGKGSLKGGISGFSIYGLTRVAKCPTPLASAITTSLISVSSSFVNYKKGRITKEEFIEVSYTSCYESAICCIGAALGSLVLPPPIGAVAGTLIAQGTLKVVELVCDEEGVIKKMEEEYNLIKKQLNAKTEEYLKPIWELYDKFDNLVELLSDDDANCRLVSSIELCKVVSIPEEEIIKSEAELNAFILS